MGDHYGSELPAHAPFSYNKYQTIHGVDSFIAPRDLRRMGKGRQPRKPAKNACRTRLFSRSCWTWRVFGHFHKQNGAFAKWGRRVHPFHGFETVRWSGSHVPWRAAVWRRGILFPEVAGAAEVSRRPRHEPPVCRRERCASRPVRVERTEPSGFDVCAPIRGPSVGRARHDLSERRRPGGQPSGHLSRRPRQERDRVSRSRIRAAS